jgi:hypothetical protein
MGLLSTQNMTANSFKTKTKTKFTKGSTKSENIKFSPNTAG